MSNVFIRTELSVMTSSPARTSAMKPIAGSPPLESRCWRTAPTPSQIAAGTVIPSEGTPSTARISASRARRSLIGMTVATGPR